MGWAVQPGRQAGELGYTQSPRRSHYLTGIGTAKEPGLNPETWKENGGTRQGGRDLDLSDLGSLAGDIREQPQELIAKGAAQRCSKRKRKEEREGEDTASSF